MSIIMIGSFLCELLRSYKRALSLCQAACFRTSCWSSPESWVSRLKIGISISRLDTRDPGTVKPFSRGDGFSRRLEHQAQERRGNQRAAKNRERQTVAAGEVIEKSEKR